MAEQARHAIYQLNLIRAEARTQICSTAAPSVFQPDFHIDRRAYFRQQKNAARSDRLRIVADQVCLRHSLLICGSQHIEYASHPCRKALHIVQPLW